MYMQIPEICESFDTTFQQMEYSSDIQLIVVEVADERVDWSLYPPN